VPAAAVIPAPIAYIKVVAVKKLVVGFQDSSSLVRRHGVYWLLRPPYGILTSALNCVEVNSGY